ncbi:MAG TPA: hydroxymethylglutaryl-CoA reductase, degradative [Candidatus Bathyarchaeota archaeon]|nr:hydroxymethylglutaryl-CoA reductase, degradative [Candidatus Bathyarchaeota archaeon]
MEERIQKVKELCGLTDKDVETLTVKGLSLNLADMMIENVVGLMAYPFAVAPNFRINGRDYLVPMVIEEPSVVAAASNAARMMRDGDGIKAEATDSIMIGQIQLVDVEQPKQVVEKVLAKKEEIIDLANAQTPTLVKLGGGARDVEVRILRTLKGTMVVVHLLVDCLDAMGANAVNTMCEAVSPYVEKITGCRSLLRIVSNLADRRLVRAEAVVDKDVLGGEEVVDGIVYAWAFAAADPYRAATHNKGIMNGVIAVALATAQDHRAIEAGAHAYASRSGRYMPLSTWWKDEDGNLVGRLEMPMPVGTVGGATRTHPVARVALKILGVQSAKELAEVMGAVGLAQNLAALRALATEGIQRGHMKLHARNLAIMAGAEGPLVDKVVEEMIRSGEIRFDKAVEIVKAFKKSGKA